MGGGGGGDGWQERCTLGKRWARGVVTTVGLQLRYGGGGGGGAWIATATVLDRGKSPPTYTSPRGERPLSGADTFYTTLPERGSVRLGGRAREWSGLGGVLFVCVDCGLWPARYPRILLQGSRHTRILP